MIRMFSNDINSQTVDRLFSGYQLFRKKWRDNFNYGWAYTGVRQNWLWGWSAHRPSHLKTKAKKTQVPFSNHDSSHSLLFKVIYFQNQNESDINFINYPVCSFFYVFSRKNLSNLFSRALYLIDTPFFRRLEFIRCSKLYMPFIVYLL